MSNNDDNDDFSIYVKNTKKREIVLRFKGRKLGTWPLAGT